MTGKQKEPVYPALIEAGTVPCVTCKKPHNYYRTGEKSQTWAKDGHSYVQMTGEQVVELVTKLFVA